MSGGLVYHFRKNIAYLPGEKDHDVEDHKPPSFQFHKRVLLLCKNFFRGAHERGEGVRVMWWRSKEKHPVAYEVIQWVILVIAVAALVLSCIVSRSL